MPLTERIDTDLKAAMKSGDQVRLLTVRSIRATLLELAKRGTGPVSPDDEVGALLAAAKKRKEAIDLYEKAGRTDLAANEKAELEIIQSYLPAQMSDEDAARVVASIIERTGASGAKDFGKVMPAAMKELKGRVDGAIVQQLVRKALGG